MTTARITYTFRKGTETEVVTKATPIRTPGELADYRAGIGHVRRFTDDITVTITKVEVPS